MNLKSKLNPMKFLVDEVTFNQIFPFSFQTNSHGEITFLGNSLKKLFPSIKTGRHFTHYFKIIRPKLGRTTTDPAFLTGELVILSRTLSPKDSKNTQKEEFYLRGQIVPTPPTIQGYLFIMTASITELKQITTWNLDFSDFPISDPIFDLLMLLQSERTARAKSEASKQQLQWENRISHLLYKITLASADLTESRLAIELTLKAVCQEFDWQIGQSFVRDKDNPESIISSGIWYFSDPIRYSIFKNMTSGQAFKNHQIFACQAFETGEIIWINNPLEQADCYRRKAFEAISGHCCVEVPISTHGEVVAVLEFISEKPQSAKSNLLRFFEILSHQLATVIERQNTQAREKEQLANMATSSKLAAIGEMAAGVGHEINNPLTATLLGIQWLQEKLKKDQTETEEVRKILQQMKSACERIAKIVAGLKFISREGSGDPFVEVFLQEIIEDSLILCQARFKGGGVKLIIKSFPEKIKLICRPVQISQVILNLLSNAFDAVAGTPDPWVQLEVRDLDNEVELNVTDSGHGVPPAIAEKIMRPFFTTKAIGKGTGLGLSVSSKIISDHGGSFFLDRKNPHTRFVVRLPQMKSLTL